MAQITRPLMLNHSAPSFPSLYIPTGSLVDGVFLYSTIDVWKFTTLWTIIIFECFHLAAGAYAAIVQSWKTSWLVVLLYVVMGGIEALFAGSMVGLVIGTAYQYGSFRVSTWIPLIWAVINVLVLTLSSFSIHGGL